MKLLHVVMLLTVVVIPRISTGATLEECSPAFAADMPIVWAAPTNHIPERLWTYKVVPRIFSASAISNGIMMAGLQHKGVPRPSTNSVVIRADHSKWNPRPPYFAIHPDYGAMTFFPGLPAPDSRNFARDPDAVKRALQCAALLGVDPMDLSPTNCDSGLSGVFLTRRMDGFSFARDSEGFSIQFGKDGKILGFGLQWLKLERG